MVPMPRPRTAVLAAAAGLALAAPSFAPARSAARADEVPPGQEVFFRDPDKATSSRIESLLSQSTSDSVQARRGARAALEEIGYWAVDPLVSALSTPTKAEPPIRCAASLVLDAIGDPRALDPLRQAVVREASHPLVGAFAALALGRFRDAGATGAFREAVRNPRNVDMLRAAVPLALARVRGPDALDFLREQLADQPANEPVSSARLLALGFFPDAALAPGEVRPSAPLLAAMEKSRRRGERQAALLAFLVATARRHDGKPYLLEVLGSEEAPDVVKVALIGLSAFDGADVTERLARVAAGSSADAVREVACDLLVPRGDPAAKPALFQIVRSPQSARLRASAVLALARIDDEDCRGAVLERLRDPKPAVRAAAAVGATWIVATEVRTEAAKRIDAKLRAGEQDSAARAVLQLARSVLAGERSDVLWPEVGPEPIFSEIALSYDERLLRAVNLRVEASLDLEKIHNLQNDTEIKPEGPPRLPGGGAGDGSGTGGGGTGDGGGTGGGTGGDLGGGGGGSGDLSAGADGPLGAQRTSAWQELRDLKFELRRRPYFGRDDLPGVPAAATGKK